VAILAGDTLLVEGLNLLHIACRSLSESDSKLVFDLVTEASFIISKAEALESKISGIIDSPIEDLLELIRLKAIVPEVSARLGAIIGEGKGNLVKAMGEYGRDYGILSIIAEEFMDLADIPVLRHRLKHEVPPLPLSYAIHDPNSNGEILFLLNKKQSSSKIREIVSTILTSESGKKLKNEMYALKQSASEKLLLIKNGKVRTELEILVSALTECFY
jgi:geranylgeranyl pyrophosphate synthase